MTNKVLHYSTGNSAHWYVVAWMGGDFVGKEYMYVSGWVPLLFTWNYDNIVNWLYPNTKNGRCFPGGSVVKNLPANAGDAGDVGSMTGLVRSPGEENGNPIQYSCLENSTCRGGLWGRKEWDTTEWLRTAQNKRLVLFCFFKFCWMLPFSKLFWSPRLSEYQSQQVTCSWLSSLSYFHMRQWTQNEVSVEMDKIKWRENWEV